jgi:coenzyme F420 biosynthesis associated uncharacterized protein
VTEAISWDVAQKVAARIAGQEPLASSYHFASLQPDFEELTAEAEVLVSEATGLHSLAGPARARVIDRAGWVRVNIGSFQRLLQPITDKLGSKVSATRLGPVSRGVTGAQLGTMLGWMSTRVLGQYDLLLVEEERPDDQDIVYYVGSNILAMEKRYGFPPREFRLWLALHEVTHRTQFTGVPWLRPHFLDLVERCLSQVNPDPRSFVEALRRAVGEARAGRNPLAEGGLMMLLAGPEQQAVLRQVTGMMSLLEGHGDIVMDRAGAERIPSAARFSRVLHERRANVRGTARLLQQLIGLEAKLQQYELGERFVEQVEAAGGRELFDRVWEGPEWLPDLVEIRDPSRWIERARAGVPAPG